MAGLALFDVKQEYAYVVVPEILQGDVKNVSGYTLVQDAPVLPLKQVAGYAIMSPPPSQYAMKQVMGYALVRDLIYLASATSVQSLLTIINARTKIPFTLSQLVFGIPVSDSTYSAQGLDTKLVVTAAPGSGYSGSIAVYYGRVDLAALFKNTALLISTTTASTVYAQLSAINTAYSTNFTSDDLLNTTIAAGATSLTLQSNPNSLILKPNSTLKLGS